MENIETIKESEFLDFYNSRTYTANCFNDDGSLNKNYNSFKSTGIIATIFEDRINLLFKAVRDTIYSILNESFKKNKYYFCFSLFMFT